MNIQIDEYIPPVANVVAEDDAENANLDNQTVAATIDASSQPSARISLGNYNDDDFLTKKEMCDVFKCGMRTLHRMVDRFDVPPPVWLAGRKVWRIGNLRAWIAEAARRSDEEAAQVARKMRVFKD